MSRPRPKALTSVLLSVAAWKEIEFLPWCRPAALRERREFIRRLAAYTPRDVTPEAMYHQLAHEGSRRYVLVVLLDGTPKCILKRAETKLRLRDLCG